MNLFTLPKPALVNRVIPKNSFEAYSNPKLKRNFIDHVFRITWLYKLAPETINLPAKEISEIQIFRIELKQQIDITSVLELIDRVIPYPIIFLVVFQSKMYISAAAKHPHPLNENNSVIDWTFKSGWFNTTAGKYNLNLKKSLDHAFYDFCIQLSGNSSRSNKKMPELIQFHREKATLEKEIKILKANITSSKSFKDKVAFNLQLQSMTKALNQLINS